MREGDRALVRLSAALAAGGQPRVEAALAAAADLAPRLAVEEALVQSYLFLGYPTALNALALWRRLWSEPPGPAEDDWPGWRARGERVCEAVYGGQYPRLRENIAALHPDMERWMLTEGYGKVLGRPGLELKVRELCIVALLAGQSAEPQLHSHLRGALNAGASEAEVDDALETAAGELAPEKAAAARRVWAQVRERRSRSRQNDMRE